MTDSMLTPRQQEIACMVARGLSNKRIAAHLGVSVHTVNMHLRLAAVRIPAQGTPRIKAVIWYTSISNTCLSLMSSIYVARA